MIKPILRILLVIVLILVVLAVLLAGSIIVDGLLGSGRVEAVTNTTIPGLSGGPEVRAYVAKPQGSGPFPTIIMIHEFYGLNQNIVEKAEGLAQEGYLVVAPDTFRGSSTSWVPRAIFQVITNDAEQVNQDLDAVYQWLVSKPDVDADRIATLGFCYGGRASLGYSLHNNRIAATVIFYGSPVTDPAVLLADEPTGNLDTKTSREIMELISRLNRERNITVIMVTHEEDIAAYGRRLLRFVDGRLASDESHVREARHVP